MYIHIHNTHVHTHIHIHTHLCIYIIVLQFIITTIAMYLFIINTIIYNFLQNVADYCEKMQIIIMIIIITPMFVLKRSFSLHSLNASSNL